MSETIDTGDDRRDALRTEAMWDLVVTRIRSDVDPEREYAALRSELSLGDDRTEYGFVLAAAERASNNYVRAVELLVATDMMRAEVMAATDEEIAEWRADVRDAIGKKSATNAQVDDQVMIRFPDAWHRCEMRRARSRAASRLAEELVRAWAARESTLRRMLERR